MSWGPFAEKAGGGVSMSRLVAFLFAVTYCVSLARAGAVGMGWPFAALGIVVVLAVPLQALFKTLQSWLSTTPGKKLLDTLVTKVGTSVGAAITTKTTTETGV